MKKILLVLTVTVLMFLAHVTAASACIFTAYQPEVPDSLRR
ncbi:MAG: cyclic lactone autoinducer peptide [Bacillota bacterium]